MSPGGRSEDVSLLRGAIARIEGDGRRITGFSDGTVTRGRVPLGQALPLDHLLHGGLAPGALHEIVAAGPGDAAAASGFALALAARFAAATGKGGTVRPIVWIVEETARGETGRPYAPGLAAHGLDIERLVVVSTASGQDSLWAMEEALRSKAVAAVVTDLWRLKTYDLVASRRLVLAAQASGTPGLLVPAGAAGGARALSSAAQTRFEIKAAPSLGPEISAGPRLPGRAAWSVRLARIRAGPGLRAGFDGDMVWPLVWDHEETRFCDALSLPPLAVARDRPVAAPQRGLRRSA